MRHHGLARGLERIDGARSLKGWRSSPKASRMAREMEIPPEEIVRRMATLPSAS